MRLWGTIFAAGYDRFMAATERSGRARFRQELLARAAGRVLTPRRFSRSRISFVAHRLSRYPTVNRSLPTKVTSGCTSKRT